MARTVVTPITRWAGLLLLSPLLGCSSSGDGPPTDGGDGQVDVGPSTDGTVDLSLQARDGADGDLSVAPGVLRVKPPTASELPVGQHLLLSALLVGGARPLTFELTAAPCLVKRVGEGRARRELTVSFIGPGDQPLALVLFVPPDVPAGARCALAVTGEPTLAPDAKDGVPPGPIAITVVEPVYTVRSLGDHAVSLIKGLEVETVGQLDQASREIQALTWAGGSFGGDFVAASAKRTKHVDGEAVVETASTVRLYRFGTGATGPIAPWLDLADQKINPTVMRDINWAPGGPCPSQPDALFVASGPSDAPAPGEGASDTGGIYCVAADQTIQVVADRRAMSVGIDTVGGFRAGLPPGTTYISWWGGSYRYLPGEVEVDDPAFPQGSARALRFFRRGPHAGALLLVSTDEPHALVRILPEPHQATPYLDLGGSTDRDHGKPAIASGGTFGELVVVARETPVYVEFDLEALIVGGGGASPASRPLVRSLACGREIAFDDQGETLAVVTAASQCSGDKTAHLLRFPLP